MSSDPKRPLVPHQKGRSDYRREVTAPGLARYHEQFGGDAAQFSAPDPQSLNDVVPAYLAEAVARGVALVGTGSQQSYDITKQIVQTGFREPDGTQAKKDIAKWIADPNASWETMPPGALKYEILLGILPILGSVQAARDVKRDFHNGNLSGFTLLDGLSIPMEALPFVPILVGTLRHSGDIGDAAKWWRAVEELRRAAPEVNPNEIVDMLKAQGLGEDEARRIVGLGKEGAEDFMGTGDTGGAVIGAREASGPREGERVTGVTVQKDGQTYPARPGELHKDVANRHNLGHSIEEGPGGWERGFSTTHREHIGQLEAQDVMEASGQTNARLPSGRATSEQFWQSEGRAISGGAERGLANAERADRGIPPEFQNAREWYNTLKKDYPNASDADLAQALRDTGYSEDDISMVMKGREIAKPPAPLTPDGKMARAEHMMEQYNIPPEPQGAEPAHWAEIRRAAQDGSEDVNLDRMAEVQKGLEQRQGPGYEAVSPHPENVAARTSGNGADAFNAAYPDAKVTPGDEAIAAKHNALVDAQESLDDNYDVGSTSHPADGADPKERYIVSPEKRWETNVGTADGRITPKQVAAFREANGGDLDGRYIGTWYDPNAKAVVFDISEGHNKKSMAEHVAQAGEQQGFFDRKAPPGEGFQPVSQHVADQVKSRQYLDDTIPERTAARRERLLETMTPEERAYYDRRPASGKLKMEQGLSVMPTAEEGATYAQMGAEGRKFYSESATGLAQTFGEDAPQFTVLAAATSPNTPIEKNLDGALALWNAWELEGKPTDPARIEELFREHAVPHGVTTTNRNNVVKVLSEQNPAIFAEPDFLKTDYLGGLKVNPFYANLLGDTQRATIDTHALKEVGRGGKAGGTGPTLKLSYDRRVGIGAGIRNSGEATEKLTGVPWTTDELQAARWNLIKSIGETENMGRGATAAEDYFFPGGEPHPERLQELQQRLAEPVSYPTLMNAPERQRQLEMMGRDVPDTPERVPPVQGAQNPNLDHFRRLLQRLDMARRGEPLYSVGGGLLAGQALRQTGLLQPDEQQAPALFQGQGLLGLR